MADQCECSMELEFQHLKDDVLDIKNTIKEDGKEMMRMHESEIRTEIALEAIIKTQEATNLNQDKIMGIVQDIKDTPYNAWKAMSIQVKVGVIILVASYVFGALENYGVFN